MKRIPLRRYIESAMQEVLFMPGKPWERISKELTLFIQNNYRRRIYKQTKKEK